MEGSWTASLAGHLEEIKRRDITEVSKTLCSTDCTRMGAISACSWPVPSTVPGPLGDLNAHLLNE